MERAHEKRMTNTNKLSDDVHEFLLYAQNDGKLYEEFVRPTEQLLEQKMEAGTYSHPRAIITWNYVVDAAARKYVRDFSISESWYHRFPKSVRNMAAAEWADQWRQEYEVREAAQKDA